MFSPCFLLTGYHLRFIDDVVLFAHITSFFHKDTTWIWEKESWKILSRILTFSRLPSLKNGKMRSEKQPDLSELHPLERGRERERYMNLPEGAKFVYTSTTSRLIYWVSNTAIGFQCSSKNMAIQIKMLLHMRGTNGKQEHHKLMLQLSQSDCCIFEYRFAAECSMLCAASSIRWIVLYHCQSHYTWEERIWYQNIANMSQQSPSFFYYTSL